MSLLEHSTETCNCVLYGYRDICLYRLINRSVQTMIVAYFWAYFHLLCLSYRAQCLNTLEEMSLSQPPGLALRMYPVSLSWW